MADDTTSHDKHRARFAARQAAAKQAADERAAAGDVPTGAGASTVVLGPDALIPLTGDQVRILKSSILDAIIDHLNHIPNFQRQSGEEYLLDQSYLIHAAGRRDNDPAVSHHFVKADLLSHLHDLITEEVNYGSRRISKAEVLRKADEAQEQVGFGFRSVGGIEKVLPSGADEFRRVVAEFKDEVSSLCQQTTVRHTGTQER